MLQRISAWLRPRSGESRVCITVKNEHRMICLANSLEWDHLIKLAQDCRSKTRKYLSGSQPQYRALLGALIVRSMESCTLRKANDLVGYYAPARVLCGLEHSDWTPDFRTLHDFEIMLGEKTLSVISEHIVQVATKLKFANPKGLCSDTTAQEAMIPHPTEVGLMNSFAKSVESSLKTLGKKAKKIARKSHSIIKTLKTCVREYRLFAKTKEAKAKLQREILNSSKRLSELVSDGMNRLQKDGLENLRGKKKRAAEHLKNLVEVFSRLKPQMEYYFRTGRVAKNKIVSLFLSEVYAIVRGKVGKDVEFGLKWGVNQIRGGYICLFLLSKQEKESSYVEEAVKMHIDQFGEAPKDFGYDRGGWDKKVIKNLQTLGVQNIGIAPKGKGKWRVSSSKKKKLVRERAQVEGKIGTLKFQGFNKPHAKTMEGMKNAARRAELRFNLTKLLKDCDKKIKKTSAKAA